MWVSITCKLCLFSLHVRVPLPYISELCVCLFVCVNFHHLTCVSCIYVSSHVCASFYLPPICQLCLSLFSCVSFHHITCMVCVMNPRVPTSWRGYHITTIYFCLFIMEYLNNCFAGWLIWPSSWSNKWSTMVGVFVSYNDRAKHCE